MYTTLDQVMSSVASLFVTHKGTNNTHGPPTPFLHKRLSGSREIDWLSPKLSQVLAQLKTERMERSGRRCPLMRPFAGSKPPPLVLPYYICMYLTTRTLSQETVDCRNNLYVASACIGLRLNNRLRSSLLRHKDTDITAVTVLPEVLGDEDELEAGWDSLDEMQDQIN